MVTPFLLLTNIKCVKMTHYIKKRLYLRHFYAKIFCYVILTH